MKKNTFIITAILLIGLILRLSGINFGLPSKNQALTTYNPDEPLTIYSLEAMNPSKLDFSPKRAFLWGGFSVYIVGFFLKLSQLLGIVNPASRDFLIANLREADKLYIIGRLLSVFFGTATILILYLTVKKAYNKTTGLISAGLLSITGIHVINSFYVRPDVIMLFFVSLSVYFAVKILSGENTTGNYLLAGIFIGLGTATKLSGAVYGIVPFVAHFLVPGNSYIKKAFARKLWIYLGAGALGFFIGCPYSVFDYKTFLYYMDMNFKFSNATTHPIELLLHGKGWISYLTYYLPHGAGFTLVITGISGFVYLFIKNLAFKERRNVFDILFLTSTVIVYYVIAGTKNQAAWYTLPVLPFFILFTAKLMETISEIKAFNKLTGKIIFFAVLISIVFGTAVNTFAYLKLYTSANTRELASGWIKNNVDTKQTVAIARSYFWTPGILRQYNPPFRLLMGGDIQSNLTDAIIGLEKIAGKADYVVISEFEYRDFTYPKISQEMFPEHYAALEKIMNNPAKYEKIAVFNKQAEFLGFNFVKNYPPSDWLIPNPEIIIYKRKK
ncbi:MAG: hypothetical protein A2252_03100 [Elusimicrobia bacterium RIFOXYA2_FULL_39_19]|nr:MAG: hypothetical protein A2252_03100 [Elusimicrobia bacterium RIFOXYA2_FULL_39_19]